MVLDQEQRTAILELHRRGVGVRAIATAMGIGRGTVRKVIRSGSTEVPRLERTERPVPHRERILELYGTCDGNLVRVHEELAAAGTTVSYPALTAFCRRTGIGQPEKIPAGRYDFEPGQEMQHDTSPHEIVLGGKTRKVQTASLVLCYSRMLFFQFYPRFTRFECKVFLAEALSYLGGACCRVHDRQHAPGGARRDGSGDDARARDGGLRRSLRLYLSRPRAWGRQPLWPRGTALRLSSRGISWPAAPSRTGRTPTPRRECGATGSTRPSNGTCVRVPAELFAVEQGPRLRSAARVDPADLPPARPDRGRGGICLGEHQPVLRRRRA